MMNLPDFLIVGAAKSGTTSIYSWLRQHPDVYMPAYKEPNFLADLSPSGKAIRTLTEYRALFEKGNDKFKGEASVCYLPFYQRAIPKIRDILEAPKIIIVLRNPTDRAFSHYTYFRQLGLEIAPPEEAFDLAHLIPNDPWGGEFNPYIIPSLYFKQVRAYMDAFPEVKVFLFEDLRDQSKICKELFSFLGISEKFVPDNEVRNVSGVPRFGWVGSMMKTRWFMHNVVRYLPYGLKGVMREHLLRKPFMAQEVRTRLDAWFTEDIKKLAQLLGRDLSLWISR